MGLNRVKVQPCGFCFVEYATRTEAKVAIDSFNRSVLDGMVIRVDWDYGFEAKRQFGRGRQGGQVRDEIKATERGIGASKDADRPVVMYSHAKREYSDRPPRGRGGFGRGGVLAHKRTFTDRDGDSYGYRG